MGIDEGEEEMGVFGLGLTIGPVMATTMRSSLSGTGSGAATTISIRSSRA